MKCLAFVDMHGKKKNFKKIKEKSKKVDFIINAGDFTIFEHNIKKLIGKFSRLDKKMYLIHGNHEEATVVKNLSKQYTNTHFVHSRIAKFKDIMIIGWGGGGFTIRDVDFEEWVKVVKKTIKQHKGIKIFIGHAPFYKTALDELNNEHHGNKSFTNFIKKYKIDYAFCGHFHENENKEDTIKKCKVYNPGPEGKIIKII